MSQRSDTEYPEDQNKELHATTVSKMLPSFGMHENISILSLKRASEK